MAKVFTKTKYQISIISKEYFLKWKSLNPQYDIDILTFKKMWRCIREELYKEIIANPMGVDLPLFMGNLSVKILDIDFKCAKDFNTSVLTNKITGEREKLPFITADIPKKPKIVWRKHKLFSSIPNIFGTEMARTCKKEISAGIRNNLFKYQKAFGHQTIKSKCEDVPEKSLFDLA